MTDNENQENQQEQDNIDNDKSTSIKKETTINKIKWTFCPSCGEKIPPIKNLRHCMKCGIDLVYLMEHKELPPQQYSKKEEFSKKYAPYRIPYEKIYYQPPTYGQRGYSPIKRQSIEDLDNNRDQKLWGFFTTFGITFLAYITMLAFGIGLIFLIFVFILDYNTVLSFTNSPYFLIILSSVELVLILVPVYYVGRHLQEPTLKNRLNLLGFSTREYNQVGILKEILIGIGFAFGGILLVGFTSIAIQSLVEFIFRVEIIEESASEMGVFTASADILAIILLVLTMILIIGPSEEILFRGFMQKGLVRNIGIKWGIILTAFTFAMVHIFTIFSYLVVSPLLFLIYFLLLFIPYFAISIMLCLLFHWRNENLIAVMVAHGLYDAIVIILAFIYFTSF